MGLAKREFMLTEKEIEKEEDYALLSHLRDLNNKLTEKSKRIAIISEELEDLTEDVLIIRGKTLHIKEYMEGRNESN